MKRGENSTLKKHDAPNCSSVRLCHQKGGEILQRHRLSFHPQWVEEVKSGSNDGST